MRRILEVLIAISVAALFYCGSGVIQTLMLSGAPNYSAARATRNLNFWVPLAGACLASTLICVWFRLRLRRSPTEGKQHPS
jgi:hypothetical protein